MIHPSIEGFWKFCSLRQEAYWLRQVGAKHPDPAFRYHFCNVYREADRGTLWFREQLPFVSDLDEESGVDREKLSDLLWFSVAYRLVNRLDTFKDYGGLPERADKAHWLRFLRERMAGGHKVFTGRHLNVGFQKYSAALDYVDQNLHDLTNLVRSSLYLNSVVKALETVPGIGTFFGWQLTCDLMEDKQLDRVTDADKWVHLGPGAWNALKLIYPGTMRRYSVDQAVELWGTQSRYVAPDIDHCDECGGTGKIHSHNDICNDCNVPGRWVMNPPPEAPGPMSLKNVEHALCEYARYVRVITTPEGKGVGLEVKKW